MHVTGQVVYHHWDMWTPLPMSGSLSLSLSRTQSVNSDPVKKASHNTQDLYPTGKYIYKRINPIQQYLVLQHIHLYLFFHSLLRFEHGVPILSMAKQYFINKQKKNWGKLTLHKYPKSSNWCSKNRYSSSSLSRWKKQETKRKSCQNVRKQRRPKCEYSVYIFLYFLEKIYDQNSCISKWAFYAVKHNVLQLCLYLILYSQCQNV